MGALVSFLWAPFQSYGSNIGAITSTHTNQLSKDEIKAIQKTWPILKKDIADSGKILFIELFKAHPEYQTLFKPFAHVPLGELYSHSKFHAHAVTVMYAFTSFVDTLDEGECLRELVYRAARNHFFRGVQAESIADFTSHIIAAMEKKMGGVLDHVTFEAWQKAIGIINRRFAEGLNEARNEKNAVF